MSAQALAAATPTTVTMILTDSNGLLWAGAKVLITYVAAPRNSGPFLWNGATFQTNYYFENIGPNAQLSVDLPANMDTFPEGQDSFWRFDIAPNQDDGKSVSFTVQISTAHMDLSSAFTFWSGKVVDYLVQSMPVPRATGDNDVAEVTNDGQIYFDTSLQRLKFWSSQANAWTALNTGQGIQGPPGPTGPTGATGATGPQGNPGSAGAAGATGPPNILGIGTVTTGAPGTSAAATITGTSPSQTLSLTIPSGLTGAPGATGPAGNTGATGNTGPQGPIGNTGPQGPIGNTGPAGPTVYPAVGLAVSTGSAWGTSIDPSTLVTTGQLTNYLPIAGGVVTGNLGVNGVTTLANSKLVITQAPAPVSGPPSITSNGSVVSVDNCTSWTFNSPLLVAADPTTALGVATKQYVDAHSGAGTYLPLAGGTLTGPLVESVAGAASTPALMLTGAPFTGGTATTTLPLFFLNSGATAVTTWTTAGTLIGTNAPAGFGGYFVDFRINGSAGIFTINSAGTVTSTNGNFYTLNGNVQVSSAALISTVGMALNNAALVRWSATAAFSGAIDTSISRYSAGVLQIGSGAGAGSTGSLVCQNISTNSSINVYGNLQLGFSAGNTATYPAVGSDGTNLFCNSYPGGAVYLNWDKGNSGVYFCDGAEHIVAVVSSGGWATFNGGVTASGTPGAGGNRLNFGTNAGTGYIDSYGPDTGTKGLIQIRQITSNASAYWTALGFNSSGIAEFISDVNSATRMCIGDLPSTTGSPRHMILSHSNSDANGQVSGTIMVLSEGIGYNDLMIQPMAGNTFIGVGYDRNTVVGTVVLGNLQVKGGGKAFVTDYPLDPVNKELIHCCLEGPENGVYYRGEGISDDYGEAEISLPEYFESLTRPEGRTIILTAVYDSDDEEFGQVAASRINNGRFSVRSQYAEQRFYWEVKAVRADIDVLKVVKDKKEESQYAKRN